MTPGAHEFVLPKAPSSIAAVVKSRVSGTCSRSSITKRGVGAIYGSFSGNDARRVRICASERALKHRHGRQESCVGDLLAVEHHKTGGRRDLRLALGESCPAPRWVAPPITTLAQGARRTCDRGRHTI